MKYGFIGAGVMACAFLKGMIGKGFAAADITVYDSNNERVREACNVFGVNPATSAIALAANSDVVFLAVKPNVVGTVLLEIKETADTTKPLIISVAAGKTLASIGEVLGEGHAVVRTMQNLNAEIGKSITAYCCNENVDVKMKNTVLSCIGAIGSAVELEEKLFPVFTAIGSCSPAFVFMFIESLARAAVKNGMDREKALGIAIKATLGSAELLEYKGVHPRELTDMVCSPGGMTVEGVGALIRNGFEDSIIAAVDAAVAKDKML